MYLDLAAAIADESQFSERERFGSFVSTGSVEKDRHRKRRFGALARLPSTPALRLKAHVY